MASRSVIIDTAHHLYFDIEVPGVRLLMDKSMVVPVLSHHSGQFDNANLYRTDGWSIKHLHTLCGSSALSEVKKIS